eukprot:74694-Pyramimonas_sp.AAC.3
MAEWLALHLSNFSFHWPWDRWAHAADMPETAPPRLFIEEVRPPPPRGPSGLGCFIKPMKRSPPPSRPL